MKKENFLDLFFKESIPPSKKEFASLFPEIFIVIDLLNIGIFCMVSPKRGPELYFDFSGRTIVITSHHLNHKKNKEITSTKDFMSIKPDLIKFIQNNTETVSAFNKWEYDENIGYFKKSKKDRD